MKRLFPALLVSAFFVAVPFTIHADAPIRSGFGGLPLGAYHYTRWIHVEDMQAGSPVPVMRKGDKFALYRFDGKIGKGTLTSIKQDAQGTIMYTVKGDDGKQYGLEDSVFITDNPRDAMPRRMEIISNNNPAYLDIVRKILEKKGLKGVKPRILQLFRGDLNNNGYNEVIIVASNIPPQQGGDDAWKPDAGLPYYGVMPDANPKSYSLAIVRQIENGVVKEHILDSYISLKGSSPANMDWQPPHLFKIEAFADLNGDGSMEIILTDMMYEGLSHNVYYHNNNNWKCVLSNGFGT
ncbi:MAG: hypothetical protein ACI4NO_06725 [Oxalobacter sp.]